MDIEKDNHILFGEREVVKKTKYSENNFKPRAHTIMIILLAVGVAIIILLGALIGTGKFEEWAEAEKAENQKAYPEPEPEAVPEWSSSEPEKEMYSTAEPEKTSPEPESSSQPKPEPENASREPDSSSEPETEPAGSKPEMSTPESTAQPETKPETSKPEPESTAEPTIPVTMVKK